MLKLHISKGNKKMGAIQSVSLPPVTTCRAGAPCAKDCYACKICRLRPNVKQTYAENLYLLNNLPETYFEQLENAIKTNKFFRLHVSGDIPNFEYFSRVVDIAGRNEDSQILMFTKQFEIVNRYISQNGDLPKNLHCLFSGWGKWQPENPFDLPKSEVIFKDTDIPENWKICGGNCYECACRGVGCWELKKGETIAFYKH